MIYSIDTSIFIEAWVNHYPRDVFPAVWEKFETSIDQKKFKIVFEVYRELNQIDDDLFAWAKRRRSKFIRLDAAIQRRAAGILTRFPRLAKADATRRDADPFVIALAAEEGLTVVTYEKSKPSKPHIPDVCRHMSIPCITLVELFRNEGWQF